MIRPPSKNISKIFREEGHLIDEALRQAVRAALRRHKLLGESIVIWKDGRVVWVPPEEIPCDDVEPAPMVTAVTAAHQAALASFGERLRESARFHMGTGDIHRTLRDLARDLVQAGIDYAVLGGMALNAHGYARETMHVDVLVRPAGLESFQERLVGRGYVPAFAGARKSFRNTATNTKVEFLTTGDYPGDGRPRPVAFPDPVAVAVTIDGIRFVDLPNLISLKLASGMMQPARRRDLADVQDLISTLSLPRDFADQLLPYVRDTYHLLWN
ncbi:MAG: hypothetical protein AB1716_11460, partial [Planctomycetota bacterium]